MIMNSTIRKCSFFSKCTLPTVSIVHHSKQADSELTLPSYEPKQAFLLFKVTVKALADLMT